MAPLSSAAFSALSPIANIPPVSVCMGCHRIVATDKPEVQKLAGYYERGEPIPWVEVYKLPDFVKFNHKRHVKAGVQCMESACWSSPRFSIRSPATSRPTC